jgi:steroid delta-isomerase-like uncharacterized protein
MSRAETPTLIRRNYDAFNADDVGRMLDCLSDDIEHRVNEGAHRIDRDRFADFCAHMSESYRERLTDVVVFANDDGSRAAAEFTVHGTYLKTDPGLPVARGQQHVLPAGGFIDVHDRQIARMKTYRNLRDWIAQVSA